MMLLYSNNNYCRLETFEEVFFFVYDIVNRYTAETEIRESPPIVNIQRAVGYIRGDRKHNFGYVKYYTRVLNFYILLFARTHEIYRKLFLLVLDLFFSTPSHKPRRNSVQNFSLFAANCKIVQFFLLVFRNEESEAGREYYTKIRTTPPPYTNDLRYLCKNFSFWRYTSLPSNISKTRPQTKNF